MFIQELSEYIKLLPKRFIPEFPNAWNPHPAMHLQLLPITEFETHHPFRAATGDIDCATAA